ncbi:hypothetical protein GYMLUDRAFT_33414 [Collybiopsis luxurians FD-317 M1]|nr:hypothetical protein GYMLUDRAFT_33414 [Collybiopsis luxurians FD-317 M1]
MRLVTTLILFGLLAFADAHFRLQFPPPRGVFVEDQEPNFCDGYTTAASNRTSFPLTGGLISLTSSHPQWTAAVLISNASNPTSFDNFTQITPFFQENLEGSFCMHIDLSSSNATNLNLQSGDNVTIQFLFNGGDGNLYQCADLTLDNSVNLSNQSCTNGTSTSSSGTRALGLSSASITGSLLGLAGIAFTLL